MASKSEQTFGNRLQHSRDLQVATGKLGGFVPDNNALGQVSFGAFLDSVQDANDNAAGNIQLLSDVRTARRLGYFGNASQGVAGLGTRAGRIRDYVGSMPGGKKSPSYKQIQRLTQKITNYHPPRKAVSGTPPETNAQKKEISQSEASYGSMLQHGRDLVAAVGAIPGYNPTAADLKIPALTAYLDTLATHNNNVTAALVDTGKAIADRAKLYDGDDGLSSKFQQLKASVASQYGRRSPEYASVAKIKY